MDLPDIARHFSPIARISGGRGVGVPAGVETEDITGEDGLNP